MPDPTPSPPPRRRRFVALALLAASVSFAAGVGVYTFVYAKGYSYLTNDPAACNNCHVMTEHYDSFLRSSHRSVATCNDCHTPPGLVPKYLTKASNGFWHSFYFTTGTFPDPIRIRPRNAAVTEAACQKCHASVVDAILPFDPRGGHPETDCVRCHGAVGHPR